MENELRSCREISGAADSVDRKRAEEELRSDRKMYRRLIESVGDWVWEFNEDRVLTYHSPEGSKMLGYEPDEVLGKDPFSFMPEDERERVRSIVGPAVERHDPIQRFENHLLKKDGSIITVETTGIPLFDESGRYRGYQGIHHDITELKQAEEELKVAKARAELYLDLMGHDINNMHQVALGYMELARDQHQDEKRAEFTDKAAEVLQRSTQLIGNVKKIQKLESGTVEQGLMDIGAVVKDSINTYTHVSDRDVTVNYVAVDGCYVKADELLKDVFANLIVNAIKHSPCDKPLVIDIGLSEAREDGRNFYRLTVADNGNGIPDSKKASIFGRFSHGYTMDRSSGLGLYIVKTLVEHYGGWVWAEDRVKGDHAQGARFVVLLPAVNE